MRWWVHLPNNAMAVDNQLCMEMDLSSLPPNIFMLQWQEKQGEIEYGDGTNGKPSPLFAGVGNGLRDTFIDVTPYASLFQQFLPKVPNLTISQAKKVQNDLIGVIFDAKRQEPFHYPVASGDYSWDASDATMFSSLVPSIQNNTVKTNEIATKLNTAIPHLDSEDDSIASQADSGMGAMVSQTNSAVSGVAIQTTSGFGNIAGQTNSVVASGNQLTAQVNANVVTPGNAVVSVLAAIYSEFNLTIQQTDAGRTGTMNARLQTGTVGSGIGATPGLSGNLPALPSFSPACNISTGPSPVSASFPSISAPFVTPSSIDTPSVSHEPTPWTTVAPVTTTNVSWVPIGHSTPVTVTPAEAGAIMQGIAARTNDLNVKKNAKVGQVNALTTIPAVIAYDVTTGW